MVPSGLLSRGAGGNSGIVDSDRAPKDEILDFVGLGGTGLDAGQAGGGGGAYEAEEVNVFPGQQLAVEVGSGGFAGIVLDSPPGYQTASNGYPGVVYLNYRFGPSFTVTIEPDRTLVKAKEMVQFTIRAEYTMDDGVSQPKRLTDADIKDEALISVTPLEGMIESHALDKDENNASWTSPQSKLEDVLYTCLLYTSPSPRDS